MKNISIDEPLIKLGIDKQVIEKLEQNNIKSIKELWLTSRKDLKMMDFSDSEINHIKIKLQLWGLDLNKKIYI